METTRNAPPPSAWAWSALLWLCFGVLDALESVFSMRREGMHHVWAVLFLVTLVQWLPWALATPYILLLARRFPLSRRLSWLIHFTACCAVQLSFSLFSAALDVLFNPYTEKKIPTFAQYFAPKIYDGVLIALVLYSVILTVSAALDSRERLAAQRTETARLNEQLARSQLESLRRQIEPHFLFNTLNSVSGLVREGRNDAAVQMIAGLSDLLRRSLDDAPHQQVPLSEEIEFAQKYIDIQKMRFADRLRVSMDIPAELYPAQVPSLILQPMVENAIKHGIAHRAQGGAIHIAASRSNGTLTLRIANDGPSLRPDWATTRGGIGIANVRTRLSSLYGSDSTLTLTNQPTGGVEVALSLPYLVAPHAEA